MEQMATQMNQAQSHNSDKLPSQTVQNLKNVSAITLRSGKEIEVQVDLVLVVLTCSSLLSLFHFHLEQFQTKIWKKLIRRSWRPLGK